MDVYFTLLSKQRIIVFEAGPTKILKQSLNEVSKVIRIMGFTLVPTT